MINLVNLKGPFSLIKVTSRKMIKNKYGRILILLQYLVLYLNKNVHLISSSKWGLVGLTKASSLDLAKHNILVNNSHPVLLILS